MKRTGSALQRLDSRPIPVNASEVRGVMVVRNEASRLPFTLAHHRQLDVGRFLVVDNGSTDGTVDYLLGEPDVHLFQTNESYLHARLGIEWIEDVLARYCEEQWALVLDGDEHLVYPECEFFRLPGFCKALEQHGLDCLATQFIDCYAETPITETRLDGRPFLALCPFFDADGYYHFAPQGTRIPRIYGGPRARLFWPEIDLRRDAGRVRAYVAEAFDEQAYLTAHPDVAEAVTHGIVLSGLDHFLRYGHLESRAVAIRPIADWPEQAYLELNPDVRRAIAAGILGSGLEHYLRFGQFEVRGVTGPSPPCLSQVPLLRWHSRMSLDVGRHRVEGTAWRQRNKVGGALLHFKLTADLAPRAATTAGHPANPTEPAWSLENQRYRDVLLANPRLTAMSDASVRYRDARQLVDLGIVATVPEL